jgi:hypothetical protein
MTIETNAINISEPEYYYREFANDIPQESEDNSWWDQGKRLVTVGMPFVSLCPHFSFPISIAMGGMRAGTNISRLVCCIEKANFQEVAWELLQTVIAVISLAGTIFAHPLGMLITTGHDLLIEIFTLIHHLHQAEYELALGSCLIILNNACYFAFMLDGGLKLMILSLAMQVILTLHRSQSEFRKGNFLEGGAHLLMTCIRGYQLHGQVQRFASTPSKITSQAHMTNQAKLTDAELIKKAKETGDQELSQILEKYHHKGKFEAAIYNCIDQGDWASAEILMKHHSRVEYEVATTGVYTDEPPSVPPILAVALKHSTVPFGTVESLIQNGARVEYAHYMGSYRSYMGHGRPALVIAADLNRIDLMTLLLENGANPNTGFDEYYDWSPINRTALYYLLRKEISQIENRIDAIELLLNYGANPNEQDIFFWTSWHHYVVKHNHEQRAYWLRLTRVLLEHGADMHKPYHMDTSDEPYWTSPYQLIIAHFNSGLVDAEVLNLYKEFNNK